MGKSNWGRYLAIQDFKRQPSSVIGGINYARVIATLLYDASALGLLKRVAFGLFLAPDMFPESLKSKVLIFYSHRHKGRKDYDYIVDKIRESARSEHDFVEIAEKVSLTQFKRTIGSFPQGINATRALEDSWVVRLVAAILIAKFISLRQHLFSILCENREIVAVFSDAFPYDNLVAQLGGLSGAKTITAQHGHYRILDNTNVSPDAEAYANFVSDVMVIWGESTREELESFGVSRRRLVVTGWIRNWPNYHHIQLKSVFGVMLNGSNGALANEFLLRVARIVSHHTGWKYIVRLHPNFQLPKYSKMVSQSCEFLGVMDAGDFRAQVGFSLGHSSSAAIEMILLDLPTYIVDDGTLPAILRKSGLVFREINPLLAMIQKDLLSPSVALDRQQKLKVWFNDDTDQQQKLKNLFDVSGDC